MSVLRTNGPLVLHDIIHWKTAASYDKSGKINKVFVNCLEALPMTSIGTSNSGIQYDCMESFVMSILL